MQSGSQLKVSGFGNVDPDSNMAGDAIVCIDIECDDKFSLKGFDIHSSIEMSYYQAVLGTTLSVETITGFESFKHPKGNKPRREILPPRKWCFL